MSNAQWHFVALFLLHMRLRVSNHGVGRFTSRTTTKTDGARPKDGARPTDMPFSRVGYIHNVNIEFSVNACLRLHPAEITIRICTPAQA